MSPTKGYMYASTHDKEMQAIAKWLARDDKFLIEELSTRMYIAVMDSDIDADKEECLRAAKLVALDYLKSKIIEEREEKVK